MSATNAIAAWDRYTNRLLVLSRVVAQTMLESPCKCGSCKTCERLAQLGQVAATLKNDAIAYTNAMAKAGAYCDGSHAGTPAGATKRAAAAPQPRVTPATFGVYIEWPQRISLDLAAEAHVEVVGPLTYDEAEKVGKEQMKRGAAATCVASMATCMRLQNEFRARRAGKSLAVAK